MGGGDVTVKSHANQAVLFWMWPNFSISPPTANFISEEVLGGDLIH